MALENCNVSQVQIEGAEGETQLSGYVDLLIQPLNGTTVSAEELFIGDGISQGGNIYVGGNVTNGVTQVQFIDNPDGTVTARVSYDTFIFGQLNNVNELRIDIDRRATKDPVDPPPPPPPPPPIPQEEIIKARIWDVIVADDEHEDFVTVEDEYSQYGTNVFEGPFDSNVGYTINAAETTLHPEYSQVSTIPGLAEQLELASAANDHIITKRTLVDKVPYCSRELSNSNSKLSNAFLKRTVKINEEGLANNRHFLKALGCGAPYKNNKHVDGSDSPGSSWSNEYDDLGIFSMTALQPCIGFDSDDYKNVTGVVIREQDKVYNNAGKLIEFVAYYFFFASRRGQQVAQFYTNPGDVDGSGIFTDIEPGYDLWAEASQNYVASPWAPDAIAAGTFNGDYNINEPIWYPQDYERNMIDVPLAIPDDYPCHPFPGSGGVEPTTNMGGGLLCLLAYELDRPVIKNPVGHEFVINALPKEKTVNDAKWKFDRSHYLGGLNNVTVKSDVNAEFEVEVFEENSKKYYDFDERRFKDQRSSKAFTATSNITEIPIVIPARAKTEQACDVTSGQTRLILNTANDNIKAGMSVTGSGIPNNTVVKKERFINDRGDNVIEISKPATASVVSTNLEFEGEDTYTFNILPSKNNLSNTTISDNVVSGSFSVNNLIALNIKATSSDTSTYTFPANPDTIIKGMPGTQFRKSVNSSDFTLLSSATRNHKTYSLDIPFSGKTASFDGLPAANSKVLLSEEYIDLRDNPNQEGNKKDYIAEFKNEITSVTVGASSINVSGQIVLKKLPNKTINLLIDLDNFITLT